MEWSLPAVHDVIAAAVPDRTMIVCEGTRRTYQEVADRTRGLAAFLVERGITVHRARGELERWECGQSPVALVLHNGTEYLEAMFGAYRARATPFNVNHHYTAAEVQALFAMVGAEAVVYHLALAPLVREVLDDSAAAADLVLVHVDDGSGEAPLDGSTDFEDAVTTPVGDLPEPSPDDLCLVCTGGTTGSPKAVLWRQADLFVAGMGGSADATAESLATAAIGGGGAWYAAPPLMHAAAQWTAFSGLHSGATVVLHDDATTFDAATILATAEREQVVLMSIVGDAYAQPMIAELQRRPYDLSSLRTIGTGGAITSQANKDAMFELLPHVMIVDGYGASETGGMAFGASTKGAAAGGFAPGAGAAVLSEDRTRFLEPGDTEVGWTARRGRVPLGYLDDRAKTEATFPIIDGERVAVPGDRATLDESGTIRMLGRDSMVVNTGGEKVYVEEVEEAIRAHPCVVDALVVGQPSERFGQEVVAVVQLGEGASMTATEVREFAATSIARFKAPRRVAFRDRIGRHPSGKPDYGWAREAAADAVPATG